MEKLRNILIRLSTKKWYLIFLALALINNIIFSDRLPFGFVKAVSFFFIGISLVLYIFRINIDDVKNGRKLAHIIFTDVLFWDIAIFLILLNIMFFFGLNAIFIIIFFIFSEVVSKIIVEIVKRKL